MDLTHNELSAISKIINIDITQRADEIRSKVSALNFEQRVALLDAYINGNTDIF